MNHLQVISYLDANEKNLFPNSQHTEDEIKLAMLNAPQTLDIYMQNMTLKKASTTQILSVLLGSLGVDRFYLGDIALGILKYITLGGFGIWWLADIISAQKRCRNVNCKKIMMLIERAYTNAPKENEATGSQKNTTTTFDSTRQANEELDKQKAIEIGKAALSIGKAVKKGFDDFQDGLNVK